MDKEELINELITRYQSSKVILYDVESGMITDIVEVKTDPDNPDTILIGYCE